MVAPVGVRSFRSHGSSLRSSPSYVLGASSDKGLDDGGVGVEKIVTGHSGLAGHSGGDHDNAGTSERGLEASVSRRRPGSVGRETSGHLCWGRAVGQIGGDSGGSDNIIGGKLRDLIGELAALGGVLVECCAFAHGAGATVAVVGASRPL